MSNWGRVTFNKKRNHWAVVGTWQGQRCYFSQYQTMLGPMTCDSRAMAERLRTVINADIEKGLFNPARYKNTQPLRLKKYAEAWLKEIRPDLATGTWEGYETGLRLYIIPTLGDLFLPDIGHKDLKILMKAMGHLKVDAKKNHMGCLHKLMKDARRDGHITQLPPWIEFRGKNEKTKEPIKYLTVADQLRIVAHIPKRHRHIFMFMMATGCRPSEARALRKKDIVGNQIYLQ